MSIPKHPLGLMTKVYREIFPIVHFHLNKWKNKAQLIPDQELKKQAMQSIATKTFHCEGGGILAIIAGAHKHKCVEFIVAYQTISDYLDNLCDRSTSLDPVDFRMLHQSMLDALTVGEPLKKYYQHRHEKDDGGYLHELVATCQNVLSQLDHYTLIKTHLLELAGYYCDLQVHKHVKPEERLPRLEEWFERYKNCYPDLKWYEFSACTGSTLGIFCLVSYGFNSYFNEKLANKIRKSYFPYVQGLHILLDYFIDQEEDKKGGDLNFCSYYSSTNEMQSRLEHFIQKADDHLADIPHQKFHKLVHKGLLGLYLSDEKVKTGEKAINQLAKSLIKKSGKTSYFFYLNGRAYRAIQRIGWSKSS
ncbi:tetraprenyl-beta-curcumene synthase family protein [Metabacillus arenae]|uniref:Tetraprenyl-beta-curcumene synthase family protein n=1 Tax=Metabacillus arenae TaxID=2771434 RepID=A0A926NLH2_9BACI|nr:tetraprenyl-beta-curcumene synthase family protein [Metabacillus arenae]MBD1380217.1 tetraprenyl-beta-curcumene synthase family protein [Metabacillus arenae]